MGKRNYGLDILKILSMFFILVLHINLRGGLIKTVPNGSIEYFVVLITEVVALCAVNIYGIISGYLSFSKYEKNPSNKYNFKRLIYLWLQVVSYSLATSLLLFFLGKIDLDKKSILMIFLPVANRYLWYFTAYFLLFFFIPIINHFVNDNDNRTIIAVLIPILLFFSFYQSLTARYIGDFALLYDGYSVWWLMILFYIGAVLKKTKIGSNISSAKLIISLIIIYSVSLLWKFYIPQLSIYHPDFVYFENFLYEYTSPSMLLVAIIYILLLTRVNIKGKFLKKVLPTLSTATFGVYVMHMHPFIWGRIKDSFVFILNYNIAFEPLIVLAFALIGLIIMLTIDIIRAKIFKLLRIELLCEKLDKLIHRISNKLLNKVV